MYVVFGATGQTGSAVADALLEKNQSVRVVLRSDKTAAAWRAKGADVAFADIGDLEAMTKAIWHYKHWRAAGVFEQLMSVLHQQVREQVKKNRNGQL